MPGERLHEYDLELCASATMNVRIHLAQRSVYETYKITLGEDLFAFCEDPHRESRKLLSRDDFWDLADGLDRYDFAWEPDRPVYDRSVLCAGEIRRELGVGFADEWSRCSAEFTEQLCESRLPMSEGFILIAEWCRKLRRYLTSIGATHYLPRPEGNFPTVTDAKPRPPKGPRIAPPAHSPETAEPAPAAAGADKPEPAALSKAQAADYIGVSVAAVENLIRTRQLAYAQLGSQRGRVILVEDLKRLLAERRQPTSAELTGRRKGK